MSASNQPKQGDRAGPPDKDHEQEKQQNGGHDASDSLAACSICHRNPPMHTPLHINCMRDPTCDTCRQDFFRSVISPEKHEKTPDFPYSCCDGTILNPTADKVPSMDPDFRTQYQLQLTRHAKTMLQLGTRPIFDSYLDIPMQQLVPEDGPDMKTQPLPRGNPLHYSLPPAVRPQGILAPGYGELQSRLFTPNLDIASLDVANGKLQEEEGGAPDSDPESPGSSNNGDESRGYGRLTFEDSNFVITARTVRIGRDPNALRHSKTLRDYMAPFIQRDPEDPLLLNMLLVDEDMPTAVLGSLTEMLTYAQENYQVLSGICAPNTSNTSRYEYPAPGSAMSDVSELGNVNVNDLKIHGPGDLWDVYLTTKGISRFHLELRYNDDKRYWEAEIFGANGFFVNEVYYRPDPGCTKVIGPLHSGDLLQIQAVQFQFVLFGVPDGNTGAEVSSAPATSRYSENGKDQSFDFQSGSGDQFRDINHDTASPGYDSSEWGSGDENLLKSDDEPEAGPSMPARDPAKTQDAQAEQAIRQTIESDPVEPATKSGTEEAEQMALKLEVPKKRGPGRPPKNGIMSKREEKLLKKQAQEEARKLHPPPESSQQVQKRKVGRPRKHALEEGEQPEKRKYKARKSKDDDGDEDEAGEKPAKDRPQKHKTPPLELNKEDFKPEELLKPSKNYQVLIDEVMSAAPPQGYSLKQIYKRIQEKYPYFFFRCDTKGWESSVRHNLLGSDCFKKIDGNWHRVPGVPLESGKKRKPSDSTAEPRPTGLYTNGYGNGYGPSYQPAPPPQHGGPHAMAPAPGLSQPTLPPPYARSGQAYTMPQGPRPTNGPPGGLPHQQGPSRPAFLPPQQTPATAPPANSYAASLTSLRQPGPGAPPAAHNPPYVNRPPSGPAPNGAVAGPSMPPSGPPRQQFIRPAQGPPPALQAKAPAALPNSGPNAPRAGPSPHAQQQTPNPPVSAPLGPVIEPALRTFIGDFRAQVIKHLQNLVPKSAEAITMSVISRGLGLTTRSMAPGNETHEKLILDIFRKHKFTYPSHRAKVVADGASTPSQVQEGQKRKAETMSNSNGTVRSNPLEPAAQRPRLVDEQKPTTAQSSQPPGASATGPATATPTTPGTPSQAVANANAAPSSVPARPSSAKAASVGATPSASPAPTPAERTSSAGPASGPPPRAPSSSGTPVPPDGPDKDIALLDPKLVHVIITFKDNMLKAIEGKIDQLTGEGLVMSAVHRLLGFTDAPLVQAATAKEQRNLGEAEEVMHTHLAARFQDYLRKKAAVGR